MIGRISLSYRNRVCIQGIISSACQLALPEDMVGGRRRILLQIKLCMTRVRVFFQAKAVLAPSGARFVAVKTYALDDNSVATRPALLPVE